MHGGTVIILFLSEVAAYIVPLPGQSQVKGSHYVGKSDMLRHCMAPPSRLTPAKAAEPITEVHVAEEADDFVNRFMKNQKEARSVRAQAVSRIAKSALSAAVSAVEAKISAKAALAAAASAASRGVAEAIGGHQLIPIPVPVDENPQSYQYPNLYDQNVGNQYPLHTWIAQTYLNVDSIATVSFLVGSVTTFIVLKLRRVLVMMHEKPLLAG